MYRMARQGWSLYFLVILLYGCSHTPEKQPPPIVSQGIDSVADLPNKEKIQMPIYVIVKDTIIMKDYFQFIDSLADANFKSTSPFNEYVLVHANPWIIDTLKSLDYYRQKAQGVFIYDQSQQIIFHPGDSLLIPDSTTGAAISEKLKLTRIDVNLPEFMLRVIQEQDTVFTCKVRIGQNKNSYLEYYQREVDLRTPVGEGEILIVRQHPKYVDPQTGEEYVETNRDDGRRTKMPIIPSLTPTIRGKITGTLIHATTNPKSLGKAYSHGCIGTSEPDIWSIYYYSPPGTKVTFRYDLEVTDSQGSVKKLRDIYYRSEEN